MIVVIAAMLQPVSVVGDAAEPISKLALLPGDMPATKLLRIAFRSRAN
jgi:hypothetical protein